VQKEKSKKKKKKAKGRCTVLPESFIFCVYRKCNYLKESATIHTAPENSGTAPVTE
jgi:hypothetical protein